ncbi:MAG: 3-oxoacyl-[acyl-carrier protein] reductase [Sphingobacteriales bacterium]|jgi:3-oxoacyl-[acyl-carrier protein] reductase
MNFFSVVTGASSGIGREIALELAKKGRVIALSRNTSNLDSLAKLNTNIMPITFDLTKDSMEELGKKIEDISPKINVLINNAGLLINKPFEELTSADWDQQFQVNLKAPAMLTSSLSNLLEKGKGHVVNISSMGGFQGASKFPGLSAYSATKAGLASLTECLSTEWNSKGISVNALCLGAVDTEMLAQAFPGFKAPVSAKKMGEFIADFALNGNKYFNGKVLPVSLNDPA